jgi:quercetin dioxygenase-like cupin family protein
MISISTITTFKELKLTLRSQSPPRKPTKKSSPLKQSPKMAAPLPVPRIVVASNNEQGKSVIARDQEMKVFQPFGPNTSSFATLFSTDSFPVNNSAPLPPSTTTSVPRPSRNGTVFTTSDIPPHFTSAFHRTSTLDYMVVLKGEIVLRLDDGEEVTIREGETAVQRGTIHAWVNKTDEWCRLLFVMLEGEKVVLKSGKLLEDEFHPHKASQ